MNIDLKSKVKVLKLLGKTSFLIISISKFILKIIFYIYSLLYFF